MNHLEDPLVLYGETFASRLLLGTSRYPSPQVLADAVRLAQPAMLTASAKCKVSRRRAFRWALVAAVPSAAELSSLLVRSSLPTFRRCRPARAGTSWP